MSDQHSALGRRIAEDIAFFCQPYGQSREENVSKLMRIIEPHTAPLLAAVDAVLCPPEYDDPGPYQGGIRVEDIKALRAAREGAR